MRWKLEHILKKNGGSILFEDSAIIILDKPAGMLVLPDRFDKKLPNLYELLKETFGYIYVVHRIDKDTSGVILFVKTAEAHMNLNTAFEHREIEKTYQAIIVGTPKTEVGIIDLPIAENKHGVRKMKIDKDNGKEARTDYKVLERFDGYTFVELRPHTGRTHQIRVHLSAINLPILADPLYGGERGFYLSSVKKNYQPKGEEKPLLVRTALHALSLSFIHPIIKEMKLIQAPLPKDMDAVLKALRKYQENLGSRMDDLSEK